MKIKSLSLAISSAAIIAFGDGVKIIFFIYSAGIIYTFYFFFRFYLGSLPLKNNLFNPHFELFHCLEWIRGVKITQNPVGYAPK